MACSLEATKLYTGTGAHYCDHHAELARSIPLTRPPDDVASPAHYRSGGLEAWDVIDAFDLNFRLGNVVKYILRAGRKDPAKRKQDLEKAMKYLEREVAKS